MTDLRTRLSAPEHRLRFFYVRDIPFSDTAFRGLKGRGILKIPTPVGEGARKQTSADSYGRK